MAYTDEEAQYGRCWNCGRVFTDLEEKEDHLARDCPESWDK